MEGAVLLSNGLSYILYTNSLRLMHLLNNINQ